MADRRRRSQDWECFTCGGCAKPVRRRRLPHSPPGRCLCCAFLGTVPDARLREALRTVFEAEGNPVVEAWLQRRSGDGRAEGLKAADRPPPQ